MLALTASSLEGAALICRAIIGLSYRNGIDMGMDSSYMYEQITWIARHAAAVRHTCEASAVVTRTWTDL